MIEANPIKPSKLLTQTTRPNHIIKGKPKKIIMQSSQPTKLTRDKLKFFLKKSYLKNVDLKKKGNQIWHKKENKTKS